MECMYAQAFVGVCVKITLLAMENDEYEITENSIWSQFTSVPFSSYTYHFKPPQNRVERKKRVKPMVYICNSFSSLRHPLFLYVGTQNIYQVDGYFGWTCCSCCNSPQQICCARSLTWLFREYSSAYTNSLIGHTDVCAGCYILNTPSEWGWSKNFLGILTGKNH